MPPFGFTQVQFTQPYPSTTRAQEYARMDRGEVVHSEKDQDARDGHVAFDGVRIMLGTEPDQELSYMRMFKRGQQMVMRKESFGENGYESMEINASKLGDVSATYISSHSGSLRQYHADETTALTCLAQMQSEFNSRWNLTA